MALVYRPFVSFGGGAVVVSLRYNDANGNISQLRIVNNSPFACVGYGTNAAGQTASVTGPANTTTDQNVAGLRFEMIAGLPYIPENYVYGARWPT